MFIVLYLGIGRIAYIIDGAIYCYISLQQTLHIRLD